MKYTTTQAIDLLRKGEAQIQCKGKIFEAIKLAEKAKLPFSIEWIKDNNYLVSDGAKLFFRERCLYNTMIINLSDITDEVEKLTLFDTLAISIHKVKELTNSELQLIIHDLAFDDLCEEIGAKETHSVYVLSCRVLKMSDVSNIIDLPKKDYNSFYVLPIMCSSIEFMPILTKSEAEQKYNIKIIEQ